MQLKTYNAKNAVQIRKRTAVLNINYNTGMMTFSTAAAIALNLKQTDTIEFHQDLENPSNWYISKSKNGLYFTEKKKMGKYVYFKVHSKEVARQILRSVKLNCNASIPILEEMVKIGNRNMFKLMVTSFKIK